MNEAQGSSGKKPLLNDGFVNVDYHRPDQPDREDLRYLDFFQRRGSESVSDDRDPAKNNDSSYPVNIAAHDDSSLRSPNSASRQTHAPASGLRSLPDGQGEVTVKLTPITGRVPRARKGVPVHTCEICRPPQTFTRPEHLRRHQLFHQTLQYPCTFPGCEKAFHRADLLARHATRHEPEGDKASSSSGTGSASQVASTIYTGYSTTNSVNHVLPESWQSIERRILAPYPETSFALPNDSSKDTQRSRDTGYGRVSNANSRFVGSVDAFLDQNFSLNTTVDDTRERTTISAEHASFPSLPSAPDDLLGSYEEHQKNTETSDDLGSVGSPIISDRSIHDYIVEPKPIKPDLTRPKSATDLTNNGLHNALSVPSESAFDDRYDLGDSIRLVRRAQKELRGNPSPGPTATSIDVTKVLGTGSPVAPSEVHEEILTKYSFSEGQMDQDPDANGTYVLDDHVVIPPQSLETAELTTDSGYDAQADLDRIKLIHIGSASEKADSTPDTAERRPVYSKTSNFRSTQEDFYVSEIAQGLVAGLPNGLSKELMVNLRNTLPYLLKALAIMTGYTESNPIYRRLIHLMHRSREQIADAVIKIYTFNEEDAQIDEPQSMLVENMTIPDKISLWNKQQRLPDDYDQDILPEDDGKIATYRSEDHSGLREYCGVLIRSTAFKWLHSAMLRDIEMEIVGTIDARCDIRNQIFTALGGEICFSQEEYPEMHRVLFQLPWCKDFLTEQEYDMPVHEALPRVLVLTGIHDHAWATTCREYVRAVWPQSGEMIIELFAHMLHRNIGSSSSCILEGNTHMTAKVDDTTSILEVTVVGNAYAVSEIGEILAWFQAAFQVSPIDESISSISPACHISEMSPDPLSETPHAGPTKRCVLISNMPQNEVMNSVNCCWMKLFRNPILVRGYPIPRHANIHDGIELDLGTIAALLGTKKVSVVTGKPLLKTAIAALVPLFQKDDFIYWHMIARPDWEYMSYCDGRLKTALNKALTNLSLADLGSSRHVVGWSANVKNSTGGPDAKFDIGWSGLKRPSPGCVLEKISIVGGSYITAGVSCVLGRKDKAVHIRSRDDYTMRLKWIAKKYVVLYDVVDRRAWLVDGTSALLHLVRASLKYDAADDFKSLLLYDPNALQEAPANRFGKTASIQVLTNPHNVSLRLYSKPETSREETILGISDAIRPVTTRTQTYYCFQDRVQGISDVLEQIMAHQADESAQDGIGFRFKASPRRQLEGFDFMDVATDEDPFWPRMTTLRATGRGWVDFTRAIHAVTLFGTGFGDLIQPIEPENGSVRACEECLLNSTVPKGQDSLAVCVSELQEILQKRGSTKTSPWRLVDDIYWHTPDKVFEACQCNKKSSPKHERMQVLLPSSIPKFWSRGLSSPINLRLRAVSNGAVLFGHSRRFPLRWQDHGLPEEGPPNIEIEDIESSVHDSGLGSSISSSGADNTQDSASSRSPLSFSSLNEGGKRDCRQALLSTSVVDVEGSMAKRKKVERFQAEEPAVPQREIGAGNGGAGASSSRISNFMESMVRWKHMEK